MGVTRSQVGKKLDIAQSSKDLEKILTTNTAQSKEYKQYVKNVKKRGGKEIASPAQFVKIQARLQAKRKIPGRIGRRKSRLGLGDTTRTKAISKGLRTSGMSEKEINRLKGKS